MTEQASHSAGIGRRLAAMFYDFLLLIGVMLSTAIILPLFLTLTGSQGAIEEGQTVNELEPLVDPVYFQLYAVFVITAFYCWFWTKNGQTLGMQSWRLKLVNMSGEPITLEQALKRLIGASVSILCAGCGYWWILIDKDQLSWHDRWSNTRLVVLPKHPASQAKA